MKSFKDLYCSALAVHRAKILVIVAIFTGLSIWGIWGLQVDADFMTLLDPSNSALKTYKNVLRNFPATDAFVIYIEDSRNVNEQKLQSFLGQLQSLEHVSSVRLIPVSNSAVVNEQTSSEAVLIMVKPDFEPTDFSQSRPLSKTIRNLADQSKLSVGITGSYQILIESADAVNQDMMRAGWITLVGILVLLLVIFRIPWLVVICMAATLCIGLAWTLGLVRLTMGQLNFLTATLPAIILGLGVDFSLHTIYAFHEKIVDKHHHGQIGQLQKRWELLEYVFSKIYKPLLIGAVTTSAAFLSLSIAASRGLRQMGLMGVFGIACTFLVATTVLPILLSAVPTASLVNIRRLSGRRLNKFTLLMGKGRLFAIVLLVLMIAGWGASRVRFSSNQNKLSDQTLPAYVLQNKLQRQQGLSLVPIAIVSPNVETEQAKLAFLQELNDSLFGLIESDLLAQQENDDPARFISENGSRLILAYPKENAFIPDVFKHIESVAGRIEQQFPAEGNWVTGSPFLNAALNRTIKGDLLRCSLFAGILVFIIVFYCFRKVSRTVMAMLTVGLGTILMIGLMGLLGINFTIMTIVIVPLIIGAGIDDGVHMLSRWYIENRNMLQTLHSVATPIIATSLTSIIGFGSLMISNNPGFRQLGFIVAAGLGFCVLISLGLLPSALRAFERRQV